MELCISVLDEWKWGEHLRYIEIDEAILCWTKINYRYNYEYLFGIKILVIYRIKLVKPEINVPTFPHKKSYNLQFGTKGAAAHYQFAE
jgi:hypothetical protein